MDDTLALASYNVSFAEPSFSAPDRARRAREAPGLLRDELLRHAPDVVSLQECPSPSWASDLFGPAYVSLGTRSAAHVPEGRIDLLVRRELAREATRIDLEHPALPLPAVAAIVALPNGTRVAVCAIHLPHRTEGATMRELMCEAIMQIVSQQCDNCILIGDFNMRDKEDDVVEKLVGGGWIDAWKEATGKDPRLKFTWNSRENKFHEDGFAFTCRFDRCLLRGNGLTARQFNTIGNESIDGREGDYLSDHYGIAVQVGVRPSSSSSRTGAASKVAKASIGSKNAGQSSMDTVDLTGDSDEEEADNAAACTKCDGGRDSATNNDTAKRSSNGQISADEMRRLRLQRFSGAAKTDDSKPSVVEDSKPQPSIKRVSLSNLVPANSANRKTETKQSSGGIDPVTPTHFPLSESGGARRYVIYMAIREREGSSFASGLELCKAACHDGLKHCLQMDGTRHITMFDGTLTSDQVRNLSFDGGGFDPLELELEGWCSWDAGCYLRLTGESQGALRDLLGKIDGLPSFGGKRPCDHLSLYRKRPQTEHPNPKRDFGKIRATTKSHDWGSVQGVSLRLKALGGPYEECMVLASAHSSKTNNGARRKSCNSKQSPDDWHDGCDSDSGQKGSNEVVQSARTFRDHSASGKSSILLSIISWNISETSMAAVSAAAPDPVLRSQESSNLIREECLRPHLDSQKQNGETYLPDIIALQEVPDVAWGTAVFGPSGYRSAGTQHTHAGLVDLLVRKDFTSQRIVLESRLSSSDFQRNQHSMFDDDYDDDLPLDLPSVAATVTLPCKTQVAIACCHLEPGAGSAPIRSKQCQLLMESLSEKCLNVILIGDMNMRQKEDRPTERLAGGGWVDAWKAGGSRKDMKFSWNSFTNLYHHNGFDFTCRFDRCYVRGSDVTVKQFCLVGNQPVNGREGDFLSDHYGIATTLEVNPSDDNDDDMKGISAAKSVGLERKPAANCGDLKDVGLAPGNIGESSTRDLSERSIPVQGKVAAGHPFEHANQRQSDGSSSADEGMGSEETPRRANHAKRARSTTTAATTTRMMKSIPLAKLESNSSTGGHAKKRSVLDSSSSDDSDPEAFCRAMAKKQGREYKRPRHPLRGSSSDED